MCRTRPKLPERLSRYWPSIYPQGTAAPMALARGKLIELLGRQPTRRGAGLFSFTAASGTPTRTASLLLSRGPIRATGLTRLRGGGDGLIYTQVGLVTLMGLISKHGILIAEFANELQHAGRSKREAILEATAIRLRPILMTTAAMVLGVLPLIAATGAGAASRFNLGLVIASGLSIGILFTLFVLPAVYLVFAADHSAPSEASSTERVRLPELGAI
jgi:hypothetical protein